MTVALGATATGTFTSSWTHNAGVAPRGFLVLTRIDPNFDSISTATFGGVSLSHTALSPVEKTSGEGAEVAAFFLGSSVPTGSQTVAFTGTLAEGLNGLSISLTGAADLEVVDTSSISSDSAANPSTTLSLGGRTCFCAIGFGSGQGAVGGITPLTGWTSSHEVDAGAQVCGFYVYDTIGAVDVTAGWTQTADDATALAVAVSEVAAGGRDVDAETEALTITGQAATVNAERGVLGATEALSITGQAATVAASRGVSAATEALAITGQAATVNRSRGVVAGTEALSIAGQQATVSTAQPREVDAETEALSITGQGATVGRERGVSGQTEQLSIAAQGAVVARDRGVSAGTEALSIVGQQANVTKGRALETAVAALSIEGQQATVARSRGVLASTASLELQAFPTGIGGREPAVEPGGHFIPVKDYGREQDEKRLRDRRELRELIERAAGLLDDAEESISEAEQPAPKAKSQVVSLRLELDGINAEVATAERAELEALRAQAVMVLEDAVLMHISDVVRDLIEELAEELS